MLALAFRADGSKAAHSKSSSLNPTAAGCCSEFLNFYHYHRLGSVFKGNYYKYKIYEWKAKTASQKKALRAISQCETSPLSWRWAIFNKQRRKKRLNICTNGGFKRTVYSRERNLLIQHGEKKVPARKCWQYVFSSVVTESYQGNVLMVKMD